jgi:hypothetical protein
VCSALSSIWHRRYKELFLSGVNSSKSQEDMEDTERSDLPKTHISNENVEKVRLHEAVVRKRP